MRALALSVMLGFVLVAPATLAAQVGVSCGRLAALEVHGGYGGGNDSHLLLGLAATLPVRSALQARVHATYGPGDRWLTIVGLGFELRAQGGTVRPYVGGGPLWSRRHFDSAIFPPEGPLVFTFNRLGAFALIGVAIGGDGKSESLAWLFEARGYAAGVSGLQLITGLRMGVRGAGNR